VAARRRPHQYQLFEKEKKMNVYVEEIELNVEELEAVIAPGTRINHNEMVEVDLCVEELEAVIAPVLTKNHNETLASDEVALDVEEMEELIAPGVIILQ
jgi:hypothetical protein